MRKTAKSYFIITFRNTSKQSDMFTNIRKTRLYVMLVHFTPQQNIWNWTVLRTEQGE